MKLKKEVYGTFLFSALSLTIPTCYPISHGPSYSEQNFKIKNKKVILIGIDGLRPDALKKSKTPALDYLVTNGAYSFNSMAGKHTRSGPCWSTVFTGVKENKHNVTDNSFKNNKLNKYPNLISLIEKYKPKLRDRKSTRLNSSHSQQSRMPSSA